MSASYFWAQIEARDLTDTGTSKETREPDGTIEAKRKHIIYQEEFRRQAVEMVIHSARPKLRRLENWAAADKSESLEEGVFEAPSAGQDCQAAKNSGANNGRGNQV